MGAVRHQQMNGPGPSSQAPASILGTHKLERLPLPRVRPAPKSLVTLSQHRSSFRKQRMFTSLMMLAVEANSVIALRMMKLVRGNKNAQREAELMVNEKIRAAFEATANLMTGASADEIVDRYRQHVAGNAKRLGKLTSGKSRSRVVKRTRRRRK